MAFNNVASTRWATNASKTTIKSVAAASALALVATAGVSIASARTDVLVNADGATSVVTVWGGTVGGALEAAGVKVGEHDLVTPAVSAPVEKGQTITFTSAKPYTIRDELGRSEVWSTADSLEGVMSVFADSGRNVAIAANRSSVREALPAVLNEAGTVSVVVDGNAKSVEVPEDATVPDILEAANITPSPIDQVFLETGDGDVKVNIVRQTRGTVTDVEELDFKTVERDTDELYEGESRVVQEGQKGKITTVKYEQKRGSEVLVSTKVSEDREEPTDKIVEHGTKKRPAGAVAAAPQQGSGTGSAPAGVWAALAQCESGGNPGTNTGNGFYGLYQFSLPTWQAVGGSGLPSDASAEEQTMRAQILQQRAGWGQWPACSSMLGLR
ncbi:resuscitation-promoting factor [Actinomyces sp. HMSC065F11]|uniref:resuscitation-promoting factor n=1 Tax=Actinomyces sp. HMSC065F11 TaxID=1739395 RepID=UPI0008A2BFD1|nr:resuscitation-promoting factor [Actinomyces sp. HMSC065F11]OFR31524.1 hypothetical protein HMPREF2891_03335 [Actinomyces sp. HMSC065F11]